MALVDPNKSGGFRNVGKGDKVLACVGLEKRQNRKGNWQYEAHYTCVKDLSARDGDDGDKGASHMDRFVLLDTSLFRLGQAAKAFGHTASFDSEDKSAIADIFSKGYVVAHVASQTWEGEERFETRNWRPFTGTEEGDWAELIEKGEQGYQKMVKARKSGAGSSGGGAAGVTAARRPARKEDDGAPGDDAPENDQEIPF